MKNGFAAAGAIITYATPTGTVSNISAMRGRTSRPMEDLSGNVTLIETDRDFIISASDLMLRGVRFDPRPGDLIADNGKQFEVLPLGGKVPCFSPIYDGSILRIYTKATGHA